MTGVSSTSCGACKFLRRKCTSECVFAAYFSYDEAALHFSAVHKVFGASNVSRLLLHLPDHHRSEAAISISYEALARMQDPVYGCVAYIYALQQEVANLQEEIDVLRNHMASLNNGVTTNHYCGNNYSQAITNNPMNKSLQLSSQEGAISVLDYWTTMNYSQQEELLSTHSEINGAYNEYNHHTSLSLVPHDQPIMSTCNTTHLCKNGIPGPTPRCQESIVVEGILNHDIFDPLPWLIS